MPDIRELGDLLADLYTRAREPEANKNRVVQKYASVMDTVTLSSDTVTTSVLQAPFHWATDAASTASDLIWDFGEWA